MAACFGNDINVWLVIETKKGRRKEAVEQCVAVIIIDIFHNSR
jgi:hypothetical protein